MIDLKRLTTFRRRSASFLKQIRKSKRPLVLTVKGQAVVVLQNVEAYLRSLDIVSSAENR